MDYKHHLRLIGHELSPAQHRACKYLERHGYSLGIHFGYNNAVDKAREHWKSKKHKPHTRSLKRGTNMD